MSHDRSLLIINPISGRGKALAAQDVIIEALGGSSCVEVFVTTARGDAERAAWEAARNEIRQVVVVGGDGTINEVINSLACTEVKLGIAAFGTGNVLAHELNLPINDPEASAQVLKSSATRRIDLGKADGRYFAAMAGFGFDAAVVNRVARRIKDVIGAGAYGIAIASELVSNKPAHYTLNLDGARIETESFMIIVANSASYAYGIKVAPHASLDDGLLDVIIFEKRPRGKLSLVGQAVRVLRRTHMSDPNIKYLTARHVELDARPKVQSQLDGDSAGMTPTIVEIVPRALSVIVP